MKAVLAQIAVNPSPAPESTSGQITLNPNVIGGLGGIGVMIWAAVQIALKVWETKESTKTKTLAQSSEAKIEQNNEALSTLVEVFRKGQEADDALQARSFESMSQLISQLNSIKANASEQLVENLMARMEAYDKNQLAINEAFRQTNIAIADLAEVIKKLDWRSETTSKEMTTHFHDFTETVKRIHQRIDNAVGSTV